MSLEIIETADGSKSLWNKDMDETYHSRHGALQEAIHVFIKNGLLAHAVSPQLSVLEFGLGTGLNAYLTWKYAKENNLKVSYTALEKFPLEWEQIKALNYSMEQTEVTLEAIHSIAWERIVPLANNFEIKKVKGDFNDIDALQIVPVDLIYYDAFGARVQPELWVEEVFEKVIRHLKPSGIIVTYSAKGSVRRAWENLGLQVERLPGPPGKREMLRGTKSRD